MCQDIKVDKKVHAGMRAAVSKEVVVICEKCDKKIQTINAGLGDEIIVNGKIVTTIDMNTKDIVI